MIRPGLVERVWWTATNPVLRRELVEGLVYEVVERVVVPLVIVPAAIAAEWAQAVADAVTGAADE